MELPAVGDEASLASEAEPPDPACTVPELPAPCLAEFQFAN